MNVCQTFRQRYAERIELVDLDLLFVNRLVQHVQQVFLMRELALDLD
jgi:hypothetical protein